MVYKCFCKKTATNKGTEMNSNSGLKNQHILAILTELRKPIIRKFEGRKIHSSFKTIIWGADVTDMPLISNQ